MSEGNGKQRKTLTTRQGHPVYDNQNQRTIGDRGPATLENYHFLEKMSHFDRERIPERVVHARGTTSFGYFEPTGKVGRRADLEVHPREALPGARQAHRRRRALLDRRRRPRLLRGGPRPARLRGQVLHRGRQLGPRRQQPRRLLHPRRDQVPRLHPLAEAGPGHLRAPGPQPRLRLHLAEPESMHMVTLVFGPRGIPASYRTMQGFGVNTYKWVNEAGETKLVKYHWLPKQGVKSWTEEDAGIQQGRELGCHTQGPLRGDRARRVPGVGAQRPDDGRPRPPRARLGPARRHQDLARAGLPAQADRPHGARTARRRTSSPRTSRSRSAPACSSTGSTSPTTRCSSGARSPTRTRSATGSGRTTCSCRSTSPRTGRRPPTSATRRWPTTSTTTGENPSVNYEPSITGGLAEGPKPAHQEQGPEINARLTRCADPADRRLPPGRRALPALRAVGEGRPRRQPLDAAGRVRPADPGAHGLAPAAVRRRARRARRRRASASPPRTSSTSSRCRPRAGARPSSSASTTSATTGRATSRAS